MKRAVVFGAGSIGRGFIGASLGDAGWRVTFVDVVESLVERLNADGGYNQVIVSNDGERTNRVRNVDAVLLRDADAVAAALVEADLAATAVGLANLAGVASCLARAALARVEAGAWPLDVLLCENVHDAPRLVRRMIVGEVGLEASDGIGLVATSVGRMVPVPVPDRDHPTRVRVEEYSFLPYDASALRGEEPAVPALVPVREGFGFYSDRKLCVHNMGHCMLAYLGELRGHEYIWEATADLELRYLARGAMVETATALSRVYGVPAGDVVMHVDDLLSRFTNRALADTTERVGRDALRKMQPDDRLLGAYRLCRRAGVEPLYVGIGVALGTRRLGLEDGWDEARAWAHVQEHLFPGTDDEGRALLAAQVESVRVGADVETMVAQIDASFRPSRIV